MSVRSIVGFFGNASMYSLFKISAWLKERSINSIEKKFGTKYISLAVKLPERQFQLLVDLEDLGITRELLYARIREKETLFQFIDLLKNYRFDYIFDIGANIGMFAIIEAIFTRDETKIIAVEPVKRNYQLLKANIELNGFSERIKPINVAIGDKDSDVEIVVPSKGNWASILNERLKNDPNTRVERVPLWSLDTLFKNERVSTKNILMRFDIEGYEYNLVIGNQQVLRQLSNSYIEFEFHPGILGIRKSIELLNTLEDIGFELKYVGVNYHHHIYSLPKSLQPMAMKFITWRIPPHIIEGVVEKNVSYEELRERIVRGRYSFCPHLILYKQ